MKKLKLLAIVLAVVMVLTAFAGCAKKIDRTDDGYYTYNAAMTVSPSTWNPCTFQSTTDSVPQDYTMNSLYEFTYKKDYSGYEITGIMAVGDPVDVTGSYVGDTWGIKEGETGKAFKITLNPDACWEDGTKINADSYIYSMKQMLDPLFANSRASNYYSGTFVIHNAKAYAYSGTKAAGDSIREAMASGNYATVQDLITAMGDKPAYCNWNYSFGNTYKNGAWTGEAVDATVYSGYTVKELYDVYAIHGVELGWGSPAEFAEYFLDEASIEKAYDVVSFDKVGLIKTGDYELTIVLDNPLVGFYIKYSIGLPLVYETLYEASKKQDSTTGAWTTSYATSVDTYMSYGPYKLTKFIDGQVLEFERNDKWFGYQAKYNNVYGTFERGIDKTTQNQYQCDKIVITQAKDIATREQMFLKGQLDVLGLNAQYLANYKTSDQLYFTEGESTFYGIISADAAKLKAGETALNGGDAKSKKYNKTILTIKEFRQALCYAIDRTALCAALYPAGSAAFGLYSNAVMADPLNAVSYRSLESAKKGLCEFWGVTYGQGGEFATLEEAYNSITGFDIAQARKLVDIAVDKAIDAGLMDSSSIVKLIYGASSSSDTETKWFNTFHDMFVNLMVGTKLEGKFEYVADYTLGAQFGEKIRAGAVDTAWGFGWNGGTLDPFDLFQVYTDAALGGNYQYDQWIDRSKSIVTLNLKVGSEAAKDYTYSVAQWYQIINGLNPDLPNWAFGKVDDSVRANVLAALEKSVLLDFTTIPMMNEGAVQLKSYKVNYGRENYIYSVGRGGIRYMTFNYTDAEWTAYVNSQPQGILSYQ